MTNASNKKNISLSNPPQEISDKGVKFIADFEGCALSAYRCPSGVLTIGYGHTSAAGAPRVYAGMKIKQQQALKIFESDLKKYENEVVDAWQQNLNLQVLTGLSEFLKQKNRVLNLQGMFDAMVSFHYNTGAIFRAFWLQYLSKGDYFKGLNHLTQSYRSSKGVILKGLDRRRKSELGLMISTEYDETGSIGVNFLNACKQSNSQK